MEVHAHPHIPGRKWTHYLWEFLMLFFAVFCGFLAENQREHMIEHQREKKYINSLITDLKGDTAELTSVISFCIAKFHGMDTLAQLLNKESLSSEEEKDLYYLNHGYAANIYTMSFNERTIRQLLNSGNLRLVSRQEVSDNIMNYYGQSKDEIIGQEKIYEETSKRLIFSAEDIFDNSALSTKMNADSTFYWGRNPDKMKLITHEKDDLRKYARMIITAQGMLGHYLTMLFGMKKRGEVLLAFLEKEYK